MSPSKRFRLIAGPNGSGKSTLIRQLRESYAVNFYTVINADDILASVQKTHAYLPPFPITTSSLQDYARQSSYDDSVKVAFLDGSIDVGFDCIHFVNPAAINSYTIALLANFLQDEHIERGLSFSQETVFSHPSKVDALRKASAAGYRTYLYFVATESPEINISRVTNRFQQGGHNVPIEKIRTRFERSINQIPQALPYLSRAFFFDNSTERMNYLGSWAQEDGFKLQDECNQVIPAWFRNLIQTTKK